MWVYPLVLFGLVLLSFTSCKTEIESKLLPVLTTDTISSITQNTAICGGNITSDNGLEVSARGVCWSFNPNPTITDSLTKNAAGTGKFTSQLSSLVPDTTYYVRAYATNSDGTAYGLQVTFKTTKAVYPVLTTTKATDVSDLSATSGGSVSFNGGTTVIQRGVCWGINTFPTILDNKTTDGLGNGNFTSSISGLTAGTTYYIRSYATNKTGTGYGNQDTIKTHTIPTLTTLTAQATSQTTASSGGNINNDGGTFVTARGICWNTTGNPTTNDTKTSDGIGNGNFTSTLTNLTADITYYIRAYATNKVGTAYGNTVSIKTTKFPTNGLVLWLPFNGNTNDESGNGNNGTNDGANLTSNRFNETNSAYDFNFNNASFSKKNQQINIPYKSIFNSSTLSVSIWVYVRTYGWSGNSLKWTVPITRYQDGDWGVWGITYDATSLSASVQSTSNAQLTNKFSNPLQLNTWSNIVFTYDGSSLNLYVNGVLKSQKAGTITLKNTTCNTGITIGELNQNNGFWYYTDGKLDDIGIWNRALTQDEITNLYNIK